MEGCMFCLKHTYHGGECSGKFNCITNPCLLFERDPRGQLIVKELKLPVTFGLEIPRVDEVCNYYLIGEVDKPIKILKIRNVAWNKNKYGINEGIIIEAECQYWSDENGVIKNNPKLQLIKGGQ